MKFKIIPILLLAFCVLIPGPTGCSKTTLSKDGVYQGDKTLYRAEKITVDTYKNFDRFTKWEETYRAILPVEVSRAADVVRKNAKNWIDSSIALRDAYVATPTAANKDKLQLSLNLIDTALDEAVKFMAVNKSKAPNTGLVR